MPAGLQMDLTRFYRCISELNQVMSRGVELSVLLETICRETTVLLAAETTSLLLLDRDRERLLLSAAQGLTPKERNSIAFRPGEGVAGWVIAKAEPALVRDTNEDPRCIAFIHHKRAIRSMLVIPLVIRGEAIGCISSTHSTAGWFTKEHEELLSFLANSVVLDVENARLYRMAITDSLTGLYNRQHLAERLKEEVDRAHRYDVPLALLMADLDHFKEVNDRFGHAAGDHVLEQIAKRLSSVTREVDLVARYSADEFVALLPNTGRDGAEQAARRIIAAIRESPVEVHGETLALSMSIGGAILGLREEPRDLLARADAALYQAKSEGRDRYVFNWLSFAGLS